MARYTLNGWIYLNKNHQNLNIQCNLKANHYLLFSPYVTGMKAVKAIPSSVWNCRRIDFWWSDLLTVLSVFSLVGLLFRIFSSSARTTVYTKSQYVHGTSPFDDEGKNWLKWKEVIDIFWTHTSLNSNWNNQYYSIIRNCRTRSTPTLGAQQLPTQHCQT